MVAVVSLLGDHFEDVRTIIGQIFGEGGLAVFDAFTGKLSGIGDTIKQVFGQLTTRRVCRASKKSCPISASAV